MQAKDILLRLPLPLLNHGGLESLYSNTFPPPFFQKTKTTSFLRALKIHCSDHKVKYVCFASRRRVRYEEEDDEDEEYGHNFEISALESYSESARNEALLVRAMVDDQEAVILIFKGFSSCLSYRTSPDPTRSILPARAKITSIDRIRGPFDPSNIDYIEKGLTWDTFRTRL